MSKERGPAKRRPNDDDDYEVLEPDEESPPENESGKTQSGRKASGGIPGGSTFNEIFQSDRSIWIKILGGAVATPIILVVLMLRAKRRGGGAGAAIDLSSPTMIGALAASMVFGGILATLLTAKDVVQRRLANGQPVALMTIRSGCCLA